MSDAAPIDDAAELTRYIETRYHARHRNQLPSLAEMAERVCTSATRMYPRVSPPSCAA